MDLSTPRRVNLTPTQSALEAWEVSSVHRWKFRGPDASGTNELSPRLVATDCNGDKVEFSVEIGWKVVLEWVQQQHLMGLQVRVITIPLLF